MPIAEPALSPVRMLMEEHEVILDVLDCLEEVARRAERGAGIDASTAGEILEVLATFADACHHGKEEGALFPALIRKGLPKDVGPLAVMLSEHEQGRAEIAGMRAALATWHSGRFVQHARAYVELLRDHIAKENNVLFPMAEGMLDAQERASVLHQFASVEHEDVGPGAHERCLKQVGELVRRLGVTRANRPAPRAHGCCGH